MSKESRVIRISESIFTRLQSHAEPLVDTPATVIEKLLDSYEELKKNNWRNQTINLTQDSAKIKHFNPGDPPDLRHTKIIKIILELEKGKEKIYENKKNITWQFLVKIVHEMAIEEVKSFDKLQLITSFNIKQGQFIDNGFNHYRYEKYFDFSIQNVSANKAWLGSLEIAQKMYREIEVHFKWLNKEEAAFSGEEGILSWSPYEN